MGDRQPLDALAAEYAQGAAVYRAKIDRLRADYGSIRWVGCGLWVACAKEGGTAGPASGPRCTAAPTPRAHAHARAPSPPPRRTRGDGNCFFRSFLFGYLEHLLLTGGGAEAARVLGRLEGMKRPMVEVGGYDEIGERCRCVGCCCARCRCVGCCRACCCWVGCAWHGKGCSAQGWLGGRG